MRAIGRRLGICAAILIGSSTLADAQSVIKVGHAPFNAPLAFVPGATDANYRTLDPQAHPGQGALIELLAAIANDNRLQFRFVPLVVGEQVSQLVARNIDLITASTSATSQSQSAILFTAPVYVTSEALIVKNGDPTQYRTYEDLRGAVIGVQRGTVSAAGLLQAGIFAEVRQYDSGAELEKAVAEGAVKAGFDSSAFGAIFRLQKDKSVGWRISQSYQPTYVNVSSLGARNTDGDLVKKIDASLAKFKADGSARAIFAKFGVEQALAK
jgi:polar amino acid transport system substrate-binding protein